MSFEFLEPDRATPELGFDRVPATVLLPQARAAGGHIEARDGWRVAVDYGSEEGEREACRATVGVGDVSWLGKIELQGPAPDVAAVGAAAGAPEIELGRATGDGDPWWCPFSARRVLAVCPPGSSPALREALEDAATDARDLLARLSAIDLRPRVTPEASFRPGSVARVPAMVLRGHGDRYVLMFGSAYAQYMWVQVTDAAEPLGGLIVGAAAQEPAGEEVAAGA